MHEFGDFDEMRGDRLDRLHNNKYKKDINDYSIFSNVDGQAVMLFFCKVQKPFFAATSTKILRWQHHATRRTLRPPWPMLFYTNKWPKSLMHVTNHTSNANVLSIQCMNLGTLTKSR